MTGEGSGKRSHGGNGRAQAQAVKGAESKSRVLHLSTAPESTVQEKIGRELQALYDELVSQPVPNQLLELLGRLDEPGEKKGGKK